MRAAEFAWGTRIVLSDLNGIVGDEKVGKGLLLAWLASEITTGRMRGRPEQIMYCTTEESSTRW